MKKVKALKPKKSVGEIIFILFCASFFAIFILSYAYAGFWILTNAFNAPQTFLEKPFALPTALHFENIVTAFTITQKGFNIIGMTWNSLKLIFIHSICSIGFPPLVGYIFARYEFKLKKFLINLFIITATIPMIGTTAIMYRLCVSLNLVNNYLWEVIASSSSLGFGTIVFMNYFGGLNKELMEAAELDGAGRLRTYFSIMFPQAWPMLMASMVLGAIGSWNNFMSTYLYYPDYPNVACGLQSINVELVTYGSNYPVMFAIMIYTIGFAVVLYAVFSKKIASNMVTSGLK